MNGIETTGFYNIAMAFVGITFVVNSLDSLIRLYTDNLNIGVTRIGKVKYFLGNIAALSLLTLLFKLDFLAIQWVGALVIGLFFSCFGYILLRKFKEVAAIESSPKENKIDFTKLERVT
tara:strand:- start:117 stop:473 length:357 start_codon:yes stop_codon:yes gene_type:complete